MGHLNVILNVILNNQYEIIIIKMCINIIKMW